MNSGLILGSVGKWAVKLVNESALIGLHFAPFFCALSWHRSHGVKGVYFALHGLCTASVAHISTEAPRARNSGVCGHYRGQVDRSQPPRCHRAKMRGICGSPHVSCGVGFSGRLEGGKWVVNERRSEGVFTAFWLPFYLFYSPFGVLK